MKIAAISDTHEQLNKVTIPKDFDLLICAGDFTYRGAYFPVRNFLTQIKEIANGRPIIIVPGNHELTLDKNNNEVTELMNIYCQNNIHYLVDKEVIIDGIKFWGSPYTPWFYDWAFNVPRDIIQKHWDLIPEDTKVLILHGPPHGILDKTREGEHVGCEALTNTINTKLKSLEVCIFGHIHESYGHIKIGNTNYYNVSICNRNYEPIHPVTMIEI